MAMIIAVNFRNTITLKIMIVNDTIKVVIHLTIVTVAVMLLFIVNISMIIITKTQLAIPIVYSPSTTFQGIFTYPPMMQYSMLMHFYSYTNHRFIPLAITAILVYRLQLLLRITIWSWVHRMI